MRAILLDRSAGGDEERHIGCTLSALRVGSESGRLSVHGCGDPISSSPDLTGGESLTALRPPVRDHFMTNLTEAVCH